MENITAAQKERIEKTLNRAIEQGKILNKADADIKINQYGNVWLFWKNPKRSYKFTIFSDGNICSGLLGI